MTAIEVSEVMNPGVVPAPGSSLIALSAPITEIVLAQKAYHEVCEKLLDDNDVQVIGPKIFKKRSAWNKLAVAFGVSTSEVRTAHERDERGRIIRTECVVRAMAPNGRVSDGIGACDLYERCCDPDTCTKEEFWADSGNRRHAHCAYPCKQAHFSNPQHDIPATAFTRASNRAKADLFGMGEVSAEEISGDGSSWDHGDSAGQTSGQQRQGGGQGAAKKNTDAMRSRIFAVSKTLGMSVAVAIKEVLGDDIPEEELTFQQCRQINDWLTDEEKRQKGAA